MTRTHQQATATCQVCGARLVVSHGLARARGMARLPRHHALRDDDGVVTRWRSMA